MRLGMSLTNFFQTSLTCPDCKDNPKIGSPCEHLPTCPKVSVGSKYRHDKVVKASTSLLQCVDISHTSTQEPEYPIDNTNSEIRGDILIYNHNTPNGSFKVITSSIKPLMLDVTIKSPLSDTDLSNKSATVQHAVGTDGYNSKYLKHSALCTQNGSGACHPSTLQFVKILAKEPF